MTGDSLENRAEILAFRLGWATPPLILAILQAAEQLDREIKEEAAHD